MVKDLEEKGVRVLKDEEHPNLPKIYEVCWDSSGITVLEEYIRGERLDGFLKTGRLAESSPAGTPVSYVTR